MWMLSYTVGSHNINIKLSISQFIGIYRGRARRAVGFTTTSAISPYHNKGYEFVSRSWWAIPDTTLFDKVSQ